VRVPVVASEAASLLSLPTDVLGEVFRFVSSEDKYRMIFCRREFRGFIAKIKEFAQLGSEREAIEFFLEGNQREARIRDCANLESVKEAAALYRLIEESDVEDPVLKLFPTSEVFWDVLGSDRISSESLGVAVEAGKRFLGIRGYLQSVITGSNPNYNTGSFRFYYRAIGLLASSGPLALSGTLTSSIDFRPFQRLPNLLSFSVERSLEGFEDLVRWEGVRELMLPHTEDCSLLSGLLSLKKLNLVHSRIVDLYPLSPLVNLEWLNLPSATLIVDVTPLSSLVNLKWLSLRGSGVTDLAPLASLVKLESLDLRRTNVTELRPLASLVSLRGLDLTDSKVADLRPIAGLLNLEKLNMSNCPVSDVTPLSKLINLEELDLAYSSVLDLSPLKDLNRLKVLSTGVRFKGDKSPLYHLVDQFTLKIWN